MFIIGGTALSQGDPNLLTYGFDSHGYLCGTKPTLYAQDANATGITAPDFSKREVLHYFSPSQYSTMTLIPADSVCLEACPTGARKFGDLNDPNSEVSLVLKHKRVFVLKEELNTMPRFFYYFG